MNYKYIVGIDEVGRGPLAGPLYVCSFLLKIENLEDIVNSIDLPIRDSKKLTEKMRKHWFVCLEEKRKDNMLTYAVSRVKAQEIDRKGISLCISHAVADSLRRVVGEDIRKETLVLLDGGLKAPPEFSQQTIIRGDEQEAVIAFASIMAKVLRDEYMIGLHKKYPHYGFEKHKGYGTKYHIQAIRDFGALEEHRVTFLKNI